jgi:hypothetical protein
MASVFYCSPTNSTFFTMCCQVAICDDEQKCPRCRQDVYPFFEGMSDEDRAQAAGGYYNHNTRMMRMSAAKRNS